MKLCENEGRFTCNDVATTGADGNLPMLNGGGEMRITNALLLAGSLFLGACGGASPDAAPTGGSSAMQNVADKLKPVADPCGLVSKADMETIIANTIVAMKPGDGIDAGSCTYKTKNNDSISFGAFQADGPKQLADARLAGADDKNDTAVAAGDDSIWGFEGILTARKGEFWLTVTPPITGADDKKLPLPERKRISTEVARKVLSYAS